MLEVEIVANKFGDDLKALRGLNKRKTKVESGWASFVEVFLVDSGQDNDFFENAK